jgi:hypothetical protein
MNRARHSFAGRGSNGAWRKLLRHAQWIGLRKSRARCHANTAPASVARTCLVRSRLSVSNPRLFIDWQTHAVNSQPTPLLWFGGIQLRALSQPIHGHEDGINEEGTAPRQQTTEPVSAGEREKPP